MIILYSILISFAAFYQLWFFYLAIMNLRRNKDTLTKPAMILGFPLLYSGYLIDFLVNVILMTILFLELPQELLVTARLTRHVKDDSGYRKTVSMWICKNLLNQFDPSGCHCG